jgi:hypothetical protein
MDGMAEAKSFGVPGELMALVELAKGLKIPPIPPPPSPS